MVSSVNYTALHCISNFSFLCGASHPEEIIQTAADLGYQGIAITDECSMAGIVRAHMAAKQFNIKLIVGSEFIVDELHCVLLATDRQSYGKICQLITQARLNHEKGHYQLTRNILEQHDLSHCIGLWIPQFDIQIESLSWLKQQLSCWIAVNLSFYGHDKQRLKHLDHIAHQLNCPLVACPAIRMHQPERQPLLDTLTAIRHRRPISQLGYALSLNAEAHLRSLVHLEKIYRSDLLLQTQIINERCQFSLSELRYEYPQELVPSDETPSSYLRRLTLNGAYHRWPNGIPKTVRHTIEHELTLIQEMQYEPFFLTVYDVVHFARSRGILCQGRGSSANSVVCYCLGITEVNPEHMQLLFERFISKERDEPPDIDVDFEHHRREEVIQYIYQKYGRHRAALAATVVRYRSKSALRDVGKAFGLDAAQLHLLSQSVHRFNGHLSIEEKVQQCQLDLSSQQLQQVIKLSSQLIGFPRHLSQHVGGFVIAKEQMSDLVPIENANMAERTVIQWDKDDLESLGLLKVDVLALGMLTAIRNAFSYIQHTEGRTLDMARILTQHGDDPRVYTMIQRADTIGVFQIESRAQMSMLPRLRPANYYDLVIQIAIVRPGPIQGDMVHPYLRRRQGKESVHYPDQRIQSILERTLGVPIFQEQVMRIVMSAAGFSAGEADQVRRSMAAWSRQGGLESFEVKLKQGMQHNGYSPEFADKIFRQILGFGEYGFPESHSASFALLAYVSAWLKCHYPAAFTCALLNSQPMGFYQAAQLVQDAQRHGVTVLPIDVDQSHWNASLTASPAGDWQLRLGFNQIKGFSQHTAQRIVAARERQAFKDVQDLATRAKANQAELEILALSDSLKGLSGHRGKSFWAVSGVEKPLPLIPQPRFNEATPLLNRAKLLDEVKWDYQSSGMSLKSHPITFIRPQLNLAGILDSQRLWQQKNGTLVQTAGLIICRQRPKTATGTTFLTLEDEWGISNIIVWGKLCETQYPVILSAQLLLVKGQIQIEDNVLNIIARQLINGNHLLSEIAQSSRNFC